MGRKIIILIIAIVILFQFFIRYQKAEIGFYDVRYDRLTEVVSIKHINSNEWIKTEFKDLRTAKAYLERKERALERILQEIEIERAIEEAIDR